MMPSIEQQRRIIQALPPVELEQLKADWLAYVSEPVRLYHEPKMTTRLPTMFIVWAHSILVERDEIPSF